MNRTQVRRTSPAITAEMVQRLTLATGVPDSPWIADATPFFARCEDDLMSLHFGGRMGLLDLFNWSVSDVFTKTFNFLTYVRPEYTNLNVPTAGHLTDPCADPNGFDYGTAKITLEGFGLYGRAAPTRYIMAPTRYCETDPVYRYDGTPVTSEFEWDLRFATDVLKQDLYRHIITGNAGTGGQFDGLQQWINTGYESAILDSMVINWAGNNMSADGGGTITLNGATITPTHLINTILAVVRRFRQRISWSPSLATERENGTDLVLVMPTFLAECLLDAFTCWSVCEGGEFNPVNLMTYEARNFRDSLNGGRYGGGFIRLDGQVIDIFPYDWETIHGTNRGDIYLMTRSVGNQQLWEGEHLSATAAAGLMAANGHNEYFSSDGGRIIGVTEADNLCYKTKVWVRPRLVNRAPWLQARIMNVECTQLLNPLSPDPLDTSFYPVTSFAADQRLS
jgi:hypothetical protein